MTTIAYRDGVLAADTLVTHNGRIAGWVKKAMKIGRLLVGTCGSLNLTQPLLDWLRTGAIGPPPKMQGVKECEGTAMLILPGDIIVTIDEYGMDYIRAPFHAIGSGAQLALGAMAAGATAEEAVHIAKGIDCYTGGEITVLRAA